MLVLIASAVIYSRFFQVLPAAAIDHGLRLGESWQLTRGQTARLLAIFAAALFLPGIIVSLLQGILVAMLGDSDGFMALFVRSFTGTFLNYFGLAFLISLLAIVYDRLRVGRPPSVDLMVS